MENFRQDGLTANRPSRDGTSDATRERKSSEGSFDTNTVGASPYSKPDMDALRSICAGNTNLLPVNEVELAKWHAERFGAAEEIDRMASMPYREEVPICGKDWWEDGEHWECLMDAGHKESKHGMRGMVRKLGD